MIDTCIYIIDDLLFFCMVLSLLALFVLAIASHFKQTSYPKAKKQYHCAMLVSENSPLPATYKEEPYEFIVYKDLMQAISNLDEQRYELVILLSDTASGLSPQFLEKIYNAYDAGVQAIQLHTVIKNRKSLQTRLRALSEEMKNSFFRSGNTQLGFSASLSGFNMAIDLKWLRNNLRTAKTNLERKLFIQNIYIEYLPTVIVYCESVPVSPYRKRIWKALSFLLPSFLERNWNFCNRIGQQLIPSPLKLCIFVGIWTLLITGWDGSSSLKWWMAFFGLIITYSLAIPDYLVENKKKKKHFIWRKAH